MELKILPKSIADMIAAGEVVQRPASVVKELMENAVDAGADDVTVVVTDAGRTLIQVIDNGCGMTPDEAVLCFERHATSKIATADDLGHILTFGFRGEALASIAAVAEVTLRTRTREAEVGVEVQFAASEQVSARETAAPSGTNVSVRNLFYNIPARRKFLKSDNVELRHIVEEFQRVALTRPEIAFTLRHNGRDIHVLKKAKSLKFRILDLMGGAVTGDIVDLQAETAVARVEGFVGRPESARKTLGNQFFFVNGRYFRSAYLHKAVMKAYEELIPDGTTPSYFIYLTVAPESIDVNIHPTKTEIKFEEDSLVFQLLYACVHEALGRTVSSGNIDFDNPVNQDIPVLGTRFEEYRPCSVPTEGVDPTYDPFAAPGEPARREPPRGGYSQFVDKQENYGALFDERTLQGSRVLVIQGRFILSPCASGVMAVHVYRARCRLLYDRFLAALSEGGHATQTSLFPVQVAVGVPGRLLLEEHAALLESLGFDITPFGNDTVVVNGVPEGYSTESGKVQPMVEDLLRILQEDHSSLPGMMAQQMARRLSALGASGRDTVSPAEAQRLLDALLLCENPEFTADGKRILDILSVDEMEKRF